MESIQSIFRWFDSRSELIAYAEALRPFLGPIETEIGAKERMPGFCTCCVKATDFIVQSGVMMGRLPNLREGLICTLCGLSNRNRLMFTAIREVTSGHANPVVAILEQVSSLAGKLRELLPGIACSEYVSRDCAPGSACSLGSLKLRHESILGLSFENASLDVVVHNDVLEHVFRFQDALRECRRVLRPGGILVFTCPFLIFFDGISVRAAEAPDGLIVHHAKPEYHGDSIHPAAGALTFHHFGWPLLDECRNAGFSSVQCGVLYDPFSGFVSNNHPDWAYGNMLPVVLRAIA